MKDDFDSHNNDENDYTPSLVRFENMLKANEAYFFDVEEFEVLVDYYLDRINATKDLNVYIEVFGEEAMAQAKALDAK